MAAKSFSTLVLFSQLLSLLTIPTTVVAAPIPQLKSRAVTAKRCITWDWTLTQNMPNKIKDITFAAPIKSVHNWNAWRPGELPSGVAFRPMVHDWAKTSGDQWALIANTKESIIHYFNEPERAGISVDNAVAFWRSNMLPLRKNKGKKLVSPSCSNDQAGTDWLNSFMGKLSASEKPDYVGLHYYGTAGNDAISYITQRHSKFNIPVIITEIASNDHGSYNNAVAFSAQVANWMDTTDYVFEYAFYGLLQTIDPWVGDNARLMTSSGAFTPLFQKILHDVPMKA